MALWQIFEVALGAGEETLTGQPAGADCDLRLDDVIAGAARIALGVEEYLDPVALVIVHHVERERGERGERGDARAEQPQRHAGEVHRHDPAERDHQRGAEIGLDHHQHEGHADHHRGGNNGLQPARVDYRDEIVIAGEREDDHRLHQLRRLEADDLEIQPAPAAAADRAKRLDADQADAEEAEQGQRGQLPPLLADPRQRQRTDEEHREMPALIERPRPHAAVCRRIEHHQPEAGEREDQRQQAPRHARDPARDD